MVPDEVGSGAQTTSKLSQPIVRELTSKEIFELTRYAYSKKSEEDIAKALTRAGIMHARVLATFSKGGGGAQANIVELTYKDGSKILAYNIAGTNFLDVRDLANDYTVAVSGRSIGKLSNQISQIVQRVGQAMDHITETTEELGQYGWDQEPDRLKWHKQNIERFNKETGNKLPFVVNGHSAGGSEAIGLSAIAPELVTQVNAVNTPGAQAMLEHMFSGNKVAVDNVLSKVNVYNRGRDLVGQWGDIPEQIFII